MLGIFNRDMLSFMSLGANGEYAHCPDYVSKNIFVNSLIYFPRILRIRLDTLDT